MVVPTWIVDRLRSPLLPFGSLSSSNRRSPRFCWSGLCWLGFHCWIGRAERSISRGLCHFQVVQVSCSSTKYRWTNSWRARRQQHRTWEQEPTAIFLTLRQDWNHQNQWSIELSEQSTTSWWAFTDLSPQAHTTQIYRCFRRNQADCRPRSASCKRILNRKHKCAIEFPKSMRMWKWWWLT